LEVVEFSDISELRKREMTYINSNDKCVNIVKSYTSQEEKRFMKEQKMELLDSIETCEIFIPLRDAARGREEGGAECDRLTEGGTHSYHR